VILLVIGGKGLTIIGILNLPMLFLVLLIWSNEADFVFVLALNLVHFQGLFVGNGDDLVGMPLSLDWGEFPLGLGAVGWVVQLGDGLVVSAVSDDLNLSVFLLVKGKTVELVISTALDNKDLIPGSLRLLLKANHVGLCLP